MADTPAHLFQVSLRSAPATAPPKKPRVRIPYRWSFVACLILGVNIAGFLFGFVVVRYGGTLTIFGIASIVFLLLPVLVSFASAQFQEYDLSIFFKGTFIYLLFTSCLIFIYYSIISIANLFIFQRTILQVHDFTLLIPITVSLAWAAMLDPGRQYLQKLIERRFNVRDRQEARFIEDFTATLRQEIDLDQLRDRFLTVIQRTLHPYFVSLWIRIREQEREPSEMLEEIVIADDDPLLAYVLRHSGALEVDRLPLDSPILQSMKNQGAELLLPLTSRGELLGLLLSSTRSLLRAAAQMAYSPGAVLARVNELLCADTLPGTFVTCFYALLDPGSGKLHYANAGHDVPYSRSSEGVSELYATGMPLGLLPGMQYEEQEALVTAGGHLLLYSDGLIEAHNPDRDMFGFPRLKQLVAVSPPDASGSGIIDFLLQKLKCFTGEGWEQEDDVTLVVLQRVAAPSSQAHLIVRAPII